MKTNPDDKKKPGEEDEDKKAEASQLNSPQLDEETGKPTQKAVSSYKQAAGICKRIFDTAKDGRLKTAAIIADKYGASSPFKNKNLERVGEDWRNNYSTNPLGSVVDRSTPQLTDPIKQAEYITYSALPAEREGASEKTRHFRLRTTKMVRSWSGFPSLIGKIAQECYLYGNCAPGWIDDDWRPKAYGFDEAFLPQGTGQHSAKAQFVVYRQPMLLHDFLQKIEDKETAKDARYNWEGCIKAANEVSNKGTGGSDATQLENVNAIREGGIGNTYDGETKVVWLFHLLVREYKGGVALWTTSQQGQHGIRHVEDIHETMEDATCLFTLQEGNQKFYGSKGAGRLLTNLHIALDRARNLSADQCYLSGLPILIADDKDMNRIQPQVRHPFIIIPKGAEVSKEQVGFDWEGFKYMDSQLSGLMNAIAGAFIPPHTESDTGGATTKIEAAQKAERELAVKNGVLGRFFGHFADLMGAIQRKIYKPDNLKEAIRVHEENQAKIKSGARVVGKKIWNWLKGVVGNYEKNTKPQSDSIIADADAVQCIVDLLNDGLTIEDITELALSPAGNNVEEQPEEQDAKTVSFIETKLGNPFFNQKEMARMQANTVIGEDRANRILLPEQEDPNIEAVALRQQITEWLNMVDKEFMPVASTDDHGIHRKVMLEKLPPIFKALTIAPTPEMNEFAKLALQHYADHLASDTKMSPEAKMQEEQGIQDWKKIVEDADKKLAELAQQAAAAGVQGGAGALPPGLPGAPMMPPGPNGMMDGTEEHPDREKARAEAALRMGDQEIAHRKLDIEEKKLASQEEREAAKLATGIMQDTATQAAQATQEGIRAGDADLKAQLERTNPKPPTV